MNPKLPLALLALAASAQAQTGPWTDGELIVRSTLPQSQTQALYRCAPETGHGEVLVSGFYWGGWAGSYVFDSYRDGIVANFGMPPSIFDYNLFLVKHDGTTVAIPGTSGFTVRGMAPVGDGRIYFQHHNTTEILYLDAGDNVHTLMDASGAVPFQQNVEHMLYHPPTNSLIATTSGWWSPTDCVSGESSIWRIPLSADGTQVAGPVQCASLSGTADDVMTIGYLPGGDLLVSMVGGQWFFDSQRRVDPVTLTSTVFCSPSHSDMNGGFWSSRVGKLVVLDDWNNELVTYSQGESGGGTVLPTDFTVSDGTTGFSPHESLMILDLDGPGCKGSAQTYGAGLAGKGGIVPSLDVAGCPEFGFVFNLSIDAVVGGTTGLLAFSVSAGAVPFAGGTLWIWPIATTVTLPIGGAPGQAGAGGVGFNVLVSDPALVGAPFYMQAGFLDAAAVQGVSLTNALGLVIG